MTTKPQKKPERTRIPGALRIRLQRANINTKVDNL